MKATDLSCDGLFPALEAEGVASWIVEFNVGVILPLVVEGVVDALCGRFVWVIGRHGAVKGGNVRPEAMVQGDGAAAVPVVEEANPVVLVFVKGVAFIMADAVCKERASGLDSVVPVVEAATVVS